MFQFPLSLFHRPSNGTGNSEILIMVLMGLITKSNSATEMAVSCARFVPVFVPVGGTNKSARRKPLIHSNLRRAPGTETERTGVHERLPAA